MNIKSQKDFFSGLMFMGVGVAFAWGSSGYTIGSSARMGPGYFPLALGVLLAVLGGSVLYGAAITWPSVAAANALGLWCTAVLNINNMRDIPTDLAAGKHTIAARLGLRRAGRYHAVLLGLAAASWGVWLYHSLPPMAAILLAAALLLFYRHHDHALRNAPQRPHEYNRQLAQLSLFILLWVGANALAMGSFQAA